MLRQSTRPPILSLSVRSGVLAIAASSLTATGTLLYDTGFETTDTPPFTAGVGTATIPKLVGTDNWALAVGSNNGTTITPSTCYPFAGIDSNLVPGMGQTAALGYLGSTAPPSNTKYIRVGRQLTTEPVVAGGMAIVDFYCQIGLTQSTNSHYDNFDLLVYNWDGKILGGLNFDLTRNKLFRYDANEYSDGYVDGTSPSPYTDTGQGLASLYGKVVEVTMRVNYNTNTWSATVNSVEVVTPSIFTKRPTTGATPAARTFGSMQARWFITVPGSPGNNWMLFDNWIISAYAEPTLPATASAGYATGSTASIVVTDAQSAGWTLSSNQTWAVPSPASGTGNGSVTVTCAANTGLARTATITLGGQTCVLTQAAEPYALSAATLPAGEQEFSQDADGDGVVNGMEYALGRTATSSASDNGTAQLPVFTWTGSGSSLRPALAINLPATEPADVTYSVQVANDLSGGWTVIMEKTGGNPWTATGSSGATVTSTAAGTGRILHTVTDAQAHRFLQLQVTKAP